MDFEEWFKTYGNLQCDKDACEDAFEAGQQGKQAEIDALREMIKKLIDNTVLSIDDELEDQANKLLEGNRK